MIPIFQYYATGPWRFFYSPQFEVPTWKRGGIAFQAFQNPAPGTVPIYQFHAENPWRYIYSFSKEQAQGWQFDGIAFHAFKEEHPGTVPVYGFHADNPWRGLYSTGKTAGSGWVLDGPAFYAYPGDLVLDWEFDRMDYEKPTQPEKKRKVAMISRKVWKNQSPAEITETIKKSVTRTSTYNWELHSKFTIGGKVEFEAGIPLAAAAKSEISSKLEIGAKHSWGSSVQETYEISRTIKLPGEGAIEVNAYIDWVDDYKTPFKIYFRLSGHSETSGQLSRADLRQILEAGAFKGTIEDGPKDGQLLVGMSGEFTGSFGLETVVDIKSIPLGSAETEEEEVSGEIQA